LNSKKIEPGGYHKKLTDVMKAERIKSFKGNSEGEGEGFLWQIVRGDKT
jgi:hypothetical protein